MEPMSMTGSDAMTHPHNKRVFWQLGLLLALWFLAFLPVYPELVHTWLNNSDNSHGILVPLISAYLIFQKRHALADMDSNGSRVGLWFLAGSMLLYLMGYAGHTAVISRTMIVASLIGILWAFLGVQSLRILLFPLLFLFFMVPVPVSIIKIVSFPLQLAATKISAWLLQLLFFPVFREGNMLYFANTQLEVAEACSGIRSLVSMLMLSTLLAYFAKVKIPWKAVLLLSAIPLAFVANLLRITGTGVLAHYYGAKVARGFLHEFSGLTVFAFGFGVLFLAFILINQFGAPRDGNKDET